MKDWYSGKAIYLEPKGTGLNAPGWLQETLICAYSPPLLHTLYPQRYRDLLTVYELAFATAYQFVVGTVDGNSTFFNVKIVFM